MLAAPHDKFWFSSGVELNPAASSPVAGANPRPRRQTQNRRSNPGVRVGKFSPGKDHFSTGWTALARKPTGSAHCSRTAAAATLALAQLTCTRPILPPR